MTPAAFEQAFRCYYRPLTMYALRYTERIDDAEDIAQQAFLDTWEKLEGGTVIDNLKAYLYQAVRNDCLTRFSHPHPESLDTISSTEAVEEDEESRIIRSERDARLWTAIDHLPRERRRIFLLAKRDGLAYREIADELGISIKTVEHQLSKALKTLRETAVNVYLLCMSW